MQAAFDYIAFQDAVGETGEGVGAAAVRGIIGPVNGVDRDELVTDLEALDSAGRNFLDGADRNRIGCHCSNVLTPDESSIPERTRLCQGADGPLSHRRCTGAR